MSELSKEQLAEVVKVSQKILRVIGKENPVILANACLMVIQLIDKTTVRTNQ